MDTQPQVTKDPPKPTYPCWEYETIILTKKLSIEDLKGVLDSRGLEGWEVSGITGIDDNFLLILKRELGKEEADRRRNLKRKV